jgi:flavin-dependent dehydrogenase
MSKFLIVGHGLAGAVLAHTLIKKKQDVSVMDTNLGHSASSVSVGLVNPLIGPKLNLPKKMIECLQINQKFFAHYEKKLGSKFLH